MLTDTVDVRGDKRVPLRWRNQFWVWRKVPESEAQIGKMVIWETVNAELVIGKWQMRKRRFGNLKRMGKW